jgi:hypothetical protein
MSSAKPQTFANHARFDPLFHFFLAPVFLLTFVGSIVHAVRSPSPWSLWFIVLALAMVILTAKTRMYALKVQDRLIRLEERLRCAAVLPAPLYARTAAITERQWVALRFAPDAELPALVERVLAENMAPKQIKQAIGNWKADTFRV